MADAAARREARRQKILNNSEGRISRLLGKTSRVSEASDGLPSNNSAADADDSHSSSRVPASLRTDTNAQGEPSPDSLHTGLRARRDGRPLELSREQNAQAFSSVRDSRDMDSTSNSAQRGSGTAGHRLSGNGASSGDTSSRPASSSLGSSESPMLAEPSMKASATGVVMKHMTAVRLCSLVLLACIVRWSFHANLQSFFLGSIYVPFFLFEVTLIYCQEKFFKGAKGPQQKSMMAAALVLAGLQPDVIQTYNYIIGIFSTLLEDFSVFTFNTIVLHALMTSGQEYEQELA